MGVIGAKMFKRADPDNDGSISKDEYLASGGEVVQEGRRRP